jgi:hypothetical protein
VHFPSHDRRVDLARFQAGIWSRGVFVKLEPFVIVIGPARITIV